MAAFYLDHNVAVQVAHMLRAAGHDIVTARDLGLDHASDDEHLLTAAQQVRILVSHNRADFVLLHTAWQRWTAAWQAGQRKARRHPDPPAIAIGDANSAGSGEPAPDRATGGQRTA